MERWRDDRKHQRRHAGHTTRSAVASRSQPFRRGITLAEVLRDLLFREFPPNPPGHHMSELTHVERLWIRKQAENRIRLGRSVDQHIIDRRRVSFPLRWKASSPS